MRSKKRESHLLPLCLSLALLTCGGIELKSIAPKTQKTEFRSDFSII